MHALDDITGAIVVSAMKIHRELGPGLLESVYEAVLARELERRGFRSERRRPMRIHYDGMVFEEGFRADLVVEARVVAEIKSVEVLAPVHFKQLLTYLRLMHLEVGLLINFGNATLEEGLHRVVNGKVLINFGNATSRTAFIASSTASLPPRPPRLRVNQSA